MSMTGKVDPSPRMGQIFSINFRFVSEARTFIPLLANFSATGANMSNNSCFVNRLLISVALEKSN